LVKMYYFRQKFQFSPKLDSRFLWVISDLIFRNWIPWKNVRFWRIWKFLETLLHYMKIYKFFVNFSHFLKVTVFFCMLRNGVNSIPNSHVHISNLSVLFGVTGSVTFFSVFSCNVFLAVFHRILPKSYIFV